MEIANASLLDEGTALAEALALAKNANHKKESAQKVFIDSRIYPQSLEVLKPVARLGAGKLQPAILKNLKGERIIFPLSYNIPALTAP